MFNAREQAKSRGSNAIVGVRVDYEFTSSAMFVAVSGTAVTVDLQPLAHLIDNHTASMRVALGDDIRVWFSTHSSVDEYSDRDDTPAARPRHFLAALPTG